jgi:hypothetical protein
MPVVSGGDVSGQDFTAFLAADPVICAQHVYEYQSDSEGILAVVACASDGTGTQSLDNDVIYWDVNGDPTSIFVPPATATAPRMVNSRSSAYFTYDVDGSQKKWQFTNGTSKWGIDAPTVPITVGAHASGAVTLLNGRRYYLIFENFTTGHLSDISPISVSTGAITSKNTALSALQVSGDSQVDKKIIAATADGGDPSILYFLVELPNATTTYTDNTPELQLLSASVVQYTDVDNVEHGVIGNDPPPDAGFPTKHRGRIYLARRQNLFFSKSLDEMVTSSGLIAGRYEESFPPPNLIDISEGAEQVHGLLSDGQTLYLGTERHIRRLYGDGPLTFSKPEIVFSETGLLNQDVWKIVFLENTPIGAMWMTPDFRVIGSDFNTYKDEGEPIQNILNSINTDAAQKCWAEFFSDGPFNIYLLAVPTGTNTVPDTLCVYDMKLRDWYVWQPADRLLSGLFYLNLGGIPRWLFITEDCQVFVFDKTKIFDRQGVITQVAITSQIKTVWLDFGDPTLRKLLNELEAGTVDANLEVSVEGATTAANFLTPHAVITSSPLVTNILGQYKVFLASSATKDRFYRLTFDSTSTSTSDPDDALLDYLSVEVIPLHRI